MNMWSTLAALLSEPHLICRLLEYMGPGQRKTKVSGSSWQSTPVKGTHGDQV